MSRNCFQSLYAVSASTRRKWKLSEAFSRWQSRKTRKFSNWSRSIASRSITKSTRVTLSPSYWQRPSFERASAEHTSTIGALLCKNLCKTVTSFSTRIAACMSPKSAGYSRRGEPKCSNKRCTESRCRQRCISMDRGYSLKHLEPWMLSLDTRFGRLSWTTRQRLRTSSV